jgi:cobalt-precorrin 5A hydrolase
MSEQDGKIEKAGAAGKADFVYRILAFSEGGYRLAVRMEEVLLERGLSACAQRSGRPLKASEWTREYFRKGNCLIYIGACGIAVRSIAPLLKSKLVDPPVLVIDEQGMFVIPLLSGHLGGANREAERLASMLGAQAVLTTGTDVQKKFAVDSWADAQGLRILESERIVKVSGKVLDEQAGIRLFSRWKIGGTVPEGIGKTTVIQEESGENKVYSAEEAVKLARSTERNAEIIKSRENADVIIDVSIFPEETALHLIPKALVLGIGCRKGSSLENIEVCWEEFSAKYGFSDAALAVAASIDMKRNEAGIISFCKEKHIPFRTYSAEELNALEGKFTGSEFVRKTVGTDNVCERSAVMESGGKYSHLIAEKFSFQGVTMAAALEDVCLNWK